MGLGKCKSDEAILFLSNRVKMYLSVSGSWARGATDARMWSRGGSILGGRNNYIKGPFSSQVFDYLVSSTSALSPFFIQETEKPNNRQDEVLRCPLYRCRHPWLHRLCCRCHPSLRRKKHFHPRTNNTRVTKIVGSTVCTDELTGFCVLVDQLLH